MMRSLLALLIAAPSSTVAYSLHNVFMQRGKEMSAVRGNQFDYAHHGKDWAMGLCSTQERQSPIDFTHDMMAGAGGSKYMPSGKLSFSYLPIETSFEVENTGHSIAANFQGLGYGGITYENDWYNLMGVNFHSVSEHTFEGMHQPLEMHMVHKKHDSAALLIVAIPFNGGTVPLMQQLNAAASGAAGSAAAAAVTPAGAAGAVGSAAAPVTAAAPCPGAGLYEAPTDGFLPLNRFLSASPPAVNQKAVAHSDPINFLDLNKFLEGGTFFEYAGSQTAPPCANAVWFVRRDFVTASQKQIDVLYNAITGLSANFGNFRAVNPLNGRRVALRMGVKEEPVQQMPPPPVALGPNPRTDREYRALKWSRDALKTAKQATDYVRDLDQRLRVAAEAHAAAMTPGAAAPKPPAAAAPITPATAEVVNPLAVPPPSPEMQTVAAQAGAMIAGETQKAVAAATQSIATAAATAAASAAPPAAPSIATPVVAAR